MAAWHKSVRSINDRRRLAGIAKNEWLAAVNGKAITSPLSFLRAIAQLEIGDWLEVEIISAEGERRSERLLLRPKN